MPKEANLWKIGGKSPLEWAINQYQVKRDTKSGIINDPNALGAEYIKNLILRLITVSLESQKLVNSLPEIAEVNNVDYRQIWKDITR
ncbi:MAG: hypothetical protein IIT65_14615 [Lachnospiraceae bacterium]|nr:hypothetical protein [Lachnospiraceae bacterium]